MRVELAYLNGDGAALAWAAGCVAAAAKDRIAAMMTWNERISRPVLCAEMALCFVPLTIAWLDSLFGVSGLTKLNADIVHRYFLAVPGGTFALTMMVAVAALSLVGPVGLIAAFRSCVLGRATGGKGLALGLVAGAALVGAVYLARLWFLGSGGQVVEAWRGLVLLGVLPVMGAAHLAYLSGPAASRDNLVAE